MKHNYIPLAEFCLKHNLSKNHVYVVKAEKTRADTAFTISKGKQDLKVDDNYFVGRSNLIHKIRKINQDNYFEFTDKIPTYTLAKIVHELSGVSRTSMNQWLRVGLFMPYMRTILTTEVTKFHWILFTHRRRIAELVKKEIDA